jgi:uncharacterized protein (TIGR01777 family)
MDGVDAVIHLAGENIAAGRWSEARKREILSSRIDGTRTLIAAMSQLDRRPAVFISASGVNVYGSGPAEHDENSGGGDGFLGEVCRQWEAQAMLARKLGIRTVLVRTGVVLDPLGGALGKMLPAFQLGLGGRIGTGRQLFPWIGMDDLLDIYERLIREASFEGPVNAVHPDLVTQKAFSETLAKVLHRPAMVPLPQALIVALFGQMGEEALLADLKVLPSILLGVNHPFRHSNLQKTLAFCLGKQAIERGT